MLRKACQNVTSKSLLRGFNILFWIVQIKFINKIVKKIMGMRRLSISFFISEGIKFTYISPPLWGRTGAILILSRLMQSSPPPPPKPHITSEQWPTSIESLSCASHFIYIISLNSHNDPEKRYHYHNFTELIGQTSGSTWIWTPVCLILKRVHFQPPHTPCLLTLW